MKAERRMLAAKLPWLRSLLIVAAGLGGVLALGVIDYLTPGPVSIVLFYMLVVVLMGRYAGKCHAVFVSSVAVITITTVHWGLHRGAPQTVGELLWNDSTRFLMFSLAGWLTAEVTHLNQHLSELVEERTAQWKAEVEQHKATSTRLRDALERFEQVISNITEVFWLTDASKNQMAYISPGYERVWGRKCEDLYREPQSWLAAVHPEDREMIARLARTQQAGGGYDVEYRILQPDGAVRWIRDRAFPVRNEQGEVYRIAGLAEDITERKRTRERLQTQAAILENMAEGVVVTDDQGLIVQMNPAGERIWGYGRNEALGQPASVLSGLPEAEAAEGLREVLTALETAGSWRGTFKNRRKDGTALFCEAAISRLEVQGRILMVAVEQDVTERLRVQEQLQVQAQVLENMAEAMMMVDETGTILLTNPAQDALLGYERGELLGKSMLALAAYSAEEHRRLFGRHLEEVKADGFAARDYVARRKDGAVIEVETRSSGLSIGGRFCLIVVGQDITPRKRAEQALRQSEETLRVFLDALPEPAMLLDREAKVLLANRALAQNLRRPPDELVGQYVFGLLPVPVAESRKAMFDEVVHTRKTARYEDARAGRHFLTIHSPVLDAAGNVNRVALFALDITDRKQAEAVLAESERTYRALVETTGTGYLILDEHGRVRDANAEYVRLSGHQTLQEILGRTVVEWTVPSAREKNAAALEECLRLGAVRSLEIEYTGPNGLITPIEINGTVVQTKEGKTILALCRDITQRKAAELALTRQEALYRTLFELSPDGILLEDTNGTILDVNQALCGSFGYSREDLLHQNVRWFVPPERQGDVEAHLATLRTGQTLAHEEWNVCRNGDRRLMWLNEKPLALPDGRQGILVVTRDITQSKRTELTKEIFLTLGAKLSSVRTPIDAARTIYASAEQLWKWDAATLDLYSPATDWVEPVLYCDVVDGLRREVALAHPAGPPTPWLRRIMGAGAELTLRKAADLPEAGSIRFGDKSRLSASIMCVPMRQDGQSIGVLSIQSYTPDAYNEEDLRALQGLGDFCAGALERIQTAQALQQREELNRTILATAMDGFYALDFAADPQGAITEVNDAYCRLSGYSREELLRLRLTELQAGESAEEVARHKASIMAAGRARFETRHRRKDGQEICLEASVSSLAGGGRMFSFVRDITERKRAELAKEAFLSLGAKLSTVRTPLEAARAIYASADLLWKWDSATLDLCSPDSGEMQIVLNCDVVDEQRCEVAPVQPRTTPSAGMLRIMREGAELILEGQSSRTSGFLTFGDTARQSASRMYAPLRQEGRVVGVLSIQSYTPNAYTQEDLRTLQALADHCAGALERINAEAAQRESEELLHAFYDSPGGLRGIVELLEDDILVLSANAPQAAAFGRSVDQLRQVRATELGVTRSATTLWMEKFRQSQQSDAPVTFEYSADFRLRGTWGLATVSPLKTAHTGRSRFGYVSIDITEHKRSELLKEAILSLGATLSAASSPGEAARAVFAGADQLWQWDAAMLQLYSAERDWMDAVLLYDIVDGQRREVAATYPEGAPHKR